MRAADFRGEGILNEANMEVVYSKCKDIISLLLRIDSAEDFIDIFDEDHDGFLDEDEQILIFSVIAKRIYLIAEHLCLLKKYEAYKDLMKVVRQIESQINRYQNELRQRVHKKQLYEYNTIGGEMMNEFKENWEKKDENFAEKACNEIQQSQELLTEETKYFYDTEMSKINSFKVKPSHQIKLLENQERLVALNERVEEAVNFRNEINKLKRKDEYRLMKLKEEMEKNLRKKCDINEEKEMKKIKDRLEKEKDNLTILKNKETDILNKRIKLHERDIIQIQNSISNMYLKIGATADELYRLKERQRKTNEAIATFKAVKTFSRNPFGSGVKNSDIAMALIGLQSKFVPTTASVDSTLTGNNQNLISSALKYVIRNLRITKFDINPGSNRKFCNQSEDDLRKNDSGLKRKITNLLEQRHHKNEIMISPALYYDYNLNLKVDANDYKLLLPKIAPK
ncbi:MAG: hypothetical protein MJ252_08555 [archaeon]|nr:hypothetical protein [archaeon]